AIHAVRPGSLRGDDAFRVDREPHAEAVRIRSSVHRNPEPEHVRVAIVSKGELRRIGSTPRIALRIDHLHGPDGVRWPEGHDERCRPHHHRDAEECGADTTVVPTLDLVSTEIRRHDSVTPSTQADPPSISQLLRA